MEDFWDRRHDLGPLQRWMATLREIALAQLSTPLVIFVDEIDFCRSLPFTTDEFFAAIRECYNRRTEDPVLNRLTFCLLGVATPSDLIRDIHTTPFNIGPADRADRFHRGGSGAAGAGLRDDPAVARRCWGGSCTGPAGTLT